MVLIYILQCTDNKYYVGKTNDISIRINQHMSGDGAMWTKKYKPIKIINIINGCDSYDEDKYTIKAMAKYGINNVRGGSFVKFVLSNEERRIINQMIKGATDCCFNCGSADHYANNCDLVLTDEMKRLFDDIIKLCKLFDHELNSYIRIEDYVNSIHKANDVIFKHITFNDILLYTQNDCTLVNYYDMTRNIIKSLIDRMQHLDNMCMRVFQ